MWNGVSSEATLEECNDEICECDGAFAKMAKQMVKGALPRWARRLLIFALMGCGSFAFGETRVSVAHNGEDVLLPGDIFEVEVIATSESVRDFELVEPRSPSLRFVARQAFPVILNGDSEYVSRWVAVYQVLRSGEIVLENGSLVTGNDELEIAIGSIELLAKGFGGEQDHDEVERIGEGGALGAGDGRGFILTALLVIAGLVGFVLVWAQGRRKDSVDESNEALANREIETLQADLRKDRVAQSRIERFLESHGDRVSESLRDEARRYLYANGSDGTALARRIGEELAR